MQETRNQQIQPNIAGNTNTGMLKLLALICMVTDHVGAVFFPGMTELRIIGRIAFPLYIWCAVVGIEYTKDHRKYALRLFLFALISQPFYMLGLNHSLQELNVLFTILCGVLGLIGIREKRYGSHIWGPILAVLLGCIFKMDYGWRGILLMLVLYAARRQRGGYRHGIFSFLPLLGLRFFCCAGSIWTACSYYHSIFILWWPAVALRVQTAVYGIFGIAVYAA